MKKKYYFKKLNYILGNKWWRDVYKLEGIEIAANNLISKMKQNIYSCTKIVKSKRDKVKRNNWITESLMKSSKEKNRLYKKIKQQPIHNF